MTAPSVPTAVRWRGRTVTLTPPDPAGCVREADRLVRTNLEHRLALVAHQVAAGRRLDLVAEQLLRLADTAALGHQGVLELAAAVTDHQEAA